MVTCVLSLYWADVDAAWERAVAAGAEVIYPLEDQFYGERAGGSAIRSDQGAAISR
jgi:PhnB protein